ncbi:hypothetical protein [Vibrio cyclitrophicus]
MQQLSQAKKDKDVVALFMLAQQHLPDHEMVMDEDMLKRLTMTLTKKIGQLNRGYQELQQGNDLKSLIWKRFGGGNKAAPERVKRVSRSFEKRVTSAPRPILRYQNGETNTAALKAENRSVLF